MNVALHPSINTHFSANVISLCAGVGGLELGLRLALEHIEANSRCVCYVEREAAAAASLVASMEAGWFHPAPVWSDLGTFDGRRWRRRVDIVTSGDPCQPNSVAGKRGGAGDDRFLIDQVLRIYGECGADSLFRENVSGNADGQLAAIVPPLEAMGARVAAGIFSAGGVGASHRRERLFILATMDDTSDKRRHTRRTDNRKHDGHQPGPASQHTGSMEYSQRPERRSNGPSRFDNGADSDAQREESSAWSGTPSGELEHTEGERRGEGRAESKFRRWRKTARQPISPLADAQSKRSGEKRRYQRGSEERFARGGKQLGISVNTHAQGKLRNDHSKGREESARPTGLSGRASLPILAPGPSDAAWQAVNEQAPFLLPAHSQYDQYGLALRNAGFAPDGSSVFQSGQEMEAGLDKGQRAALRSARIQEAVESVVRGMADGVAYRVERLRAGGNGVCPLAAAVAFLSLSSLLAEHPTRKFQWAEESVR